LHVVRLICMHSARRREAETEQAARAMPVPTKLACRRSERRGPRCSPVSSGPSVMEVRREPCRQAEGW
jgi:hypothetical protein